jgi:hypothetical protein
MYPKSATLGSAEAGQVIRFTRKREFRSKVCAGSSPSALSLKASIETRAQTETKAVIEFCQTWLEQHLSGAHQYFAHYTKKQDYSVVQVWQALYRDETSRLEVADVSEYQIPRPGVPGSPAHR